MQKRLQKQSLHIQLGMLLPHYIEFLKSSLYSLSSSKMHCNEKNASVNGECKRTFNSYFVFEGVWMWRPMSQHNVPKVPVSQICTPLISRIWITSLQRTLCHFSRKEIVKNNLSFPQKITRTNYSNSALDSKFNFVMWKLLLEDESI